MSDVKHTPGPWAWFGNAGSNSVYLATEKHGRRFVMDFVRWGSRGAQPRFQPGKGVMVPASELLQFEVGDRDVVGVNAAKANSSVYRLDVRSIDCADARLIAAAPELLEALKAVKETLCEGFCRDLPAAQTYSSAMDDECSACRARAAIAKAEGR